MDMLPDLERLSEHEKDALVVALWAVVQGLRTRVAELEAKRHELVKDARNSSVPPSHTRKANTLHAHRRACVARPASVVPGVVAERSAVAGVARRACMEVSSMVGSSVSIARSTSGDAGRGDVRDTLLEEFPSGFPYCKLVVKPKVGLSITIGHF